MQFVYYTILIHVIMTHLLTLQGSLSDDERSVHYSSSGYYESPIDDDDDGGLSKIIY